MVKLVSLTPSEVCWEAKMANDRSLESTLHLTTYKQDHITVEDSTPSDCPIEDSMTCHFFNHNITIALCVSAMKYLKVLQHLSKKENFGDSLRTTTEN